MKHWLLCVSLCLLTIPAGAQQILTLDSCRAWALRYNKQMDVSRVKQEIAKNIRKSMRTKYLPHISAVGTYQYTNREISILNGDQKTALSQLGTSAVGMVNNGLTGLNTQFASIFENLGLSPSAMDQVRADLKALQDKVITGMDPVKESLNGEGQKIVDAFRTDTRNIWAGSVMAVQPIFMGGSIVAANKLAKLGEEMASNSADASRQTILFSVDKTYWQVVSLNHKKRLAESYRDVLKKLDDDVQKMIAEGVATKSDGLSVSVKLNEAEIAVQKVNDGLTLSRMLLCQMIGLPMKESVILADENNDTLAVATIVPKVEVEQALENRPELRMLDNSVAMAHQATNILKAGNLPMVAAIGGYTISNPSIQNGFEKKFKGFWNIGVLVRVPLWNWGDQMYKIRAAKGVASIASLEREEAREKIELQVNQNAFHVEEANKRLIMAESSVKKADENLRMATLGFQEGVITPTTVMEAQTAWLQAKSQQIDAQIDVKMSMVDLQKSLGTLQ